MRKSVEELVHEQYGDSPVASALLADIEKQGTRDAIEKGKAKLPHHTDAKIWHKKLTAPPPKEEEDN